MITTNYLNFNSVTEALDNFYFNLLDRVVVLDSNNVIVVQYFMVIDGEDYYFTPQIIFHKYLTRDDFHKLMYDRIPTSAHYAICDVDTYKMEIKILNVL